jgi:hypothetical protein
MASNKKQKSKGDFIDKPQWGKEQRHGGVYSASVSYIAKKGEETSSPPKKATVPRPPLYCAAGWG